MNAKQKTDLEAARTIIGKSPQGQWTIEKARAILDFYRILVDICEESDDGLESYLQIICSSPELTEDDCNRLIAALGRLN